MNFTKILYWLATSIFCLIFLFSAYIHLFNYDQVVSFYEFLGFPSWMIYPSAIAKILGVAVVLSRKSNIAKEWAYAGFFIDSAFALTSHIMADDGAGRLAFVALVSVVISRILEPYSFSKN